MGQYRYPRQVRPADRSCFSGSHRKPSLQKRHLSVKPGEFVHAPFQFLQKIILVSLNYFEAFHLLFSAEEVVRQVVHTPLRTVIPPALTQTFDFLPCQSSNRKWSLPWTYTAIAYVLQPNAASMYGGRFLLQGHCNLLFGYVHFRWSSNYPTQAELNNEQMNKSYLLIFLTMIRYAGLGCIF